MSLKLNINLTFPDTIDNPVDTASNNMRRNCRKVGELFKKMSTGNLSVSKKLGLVHAYGTVTFTGTAAAAQTVTIDGTTVTATGVGTADTDAAAMAAAINLDSTLKHKVLARAAAATDKVTIQAKVAGSAGNYSLRASGTGVTASGDALTLGDDADLVEFRTSALPAYSHILASGGAMSGAVGAVIGGVTVTDTAAGGDNQTLKLIANAINADATASTWVTAYTAPLANVNLVDTTADAFTVVVNGVSHTVTASTTEDDVGALLVTAINAQTATHGCIARYKASGDLLTVHSLASDKKIKLAVSGAGIGTSVVQGRATGEVQLTGTGAGAVVVTVGGHAHSVAGSSDEDAVGALLVTAINAKNSLHNCTASFATDTDLLTITSDYCGSVGNQIALAVSGAGIGTSAASGVVLGTGGTAAVTSGLDCCVVECKIPGVIGNAIPFVASGTNAAVNDATLLGGTESLVAYSL